MATTHALYKAQFMVQGHCNGENRSFSEDSTTLRLQSLCIIWSSVATYGLHVGKTDITKACMQVQEISRKFYVHLHTSCDLPYGQMLNISMQRPGRSNSEDAGWATLRETVTSRM